MLNGESAVGGRSGSCLPLVKPFSGRAELREYQASGSRGNIYRRRFWQKKKERKRNKQMA